MYAATEYGCMELLCMYVCMYVCMYAAAKYGVYVVLQCGCM